MRLGIQMLNNSSTLNSILPVNQVQISPGETYQVMFQFVDLDQKTGVCPAVRYIPLVGAMVSIALNSYNVSNNLTKYPYNPFPDDRSIWAFNLSASDTTNAAGINMTVTLTEGSVIRKAIATAAIIFDPQSQYSC